MSRKASLWAAIAALFSAIALIGVTLPDEAAQALAPAAQHLDHASAALSAPADGAWRSGGPYGGLVQALALSPAFASDGLAFAGGWRAGPGGGTIGYGIVRTDDFGQSWSPVFHSAPWTQLAVFDLATSFAFDSDDTAFAATDGGLLRTRNRGNTWERLGGGLPAAGSDPTADDVRRVYLSPAYAADGVLVALMADGTLFRSADRGDTWTRLSIGRTFAAAFSRDFASSNTISAVILTGEPPALALARSTDRGDTWAVVQPLALSPVTDLVEVADAALLVATENGVARLAPDGAGYTPEPVALNISGAVHRLAVAGDHVYAAGQNGLFISLSAGRGWQRYADTPSTAFLSVAVCPHWGRCHALMAGSYAGVLGTLDDNLEPWRWLAGVRRLNTKAVAASPTYATDGT
ncbi:MAG: WD40/YVTN/BNR-like repeat-containing protein, partial [Anaerolineae bacterium]